MRSWLDDDLASLLAKYFGEKFSRKPPTGQDARVGADQDVRNGASLPDTEPGADTTAEPGKPERAR